MACRIALITIILVFFNEGTVRASVNWEAGTCQLNIPEKELKESLYVFTGPGGTNTDYTYTIEQQTVFNIDENGKLSSASDLDFESDGNPYTVDIIATHTNTTVYTVKCAIKVTRLGFVQNPYAVDTVNNVTIATSILSVSATYTDVPAESYEIVYSVKAEKDGGNFSIDPSSGDIGAKILLTAKNPPTLTLTVIATDKNVATSTAEASVIVCVGCKKSGSSAPEISLFASMALVFSVFLM